MVKVLVVCSKNSGRIAPFIIEQVEAINKLGITTDYFTVEQKGLMGYLKSRKLLLQKIRSFQPDLIHAHYGMSGLLANLQRRIPVVVTYHGSDININKTLRFSRISILLSKYNIFVSQANIQKSKVKKNFALIPCGVNTDIFKLMDKDAARQQLQLEKNKQYVLFSASFQNPVKNSVLAIEAVQNIPNLELIELKGYTRQEVAVLMNAVDVCFMTSFTEGSPQFIKEAMACNCPIVSVNVGDVSEIIGETKNCYISSYDAHQLRRNLRIALQNNQRTKGRERIVEMRLELDTIAKKIVDVYKRVLTKK